MSSLSSIYVKKETLKTLLDVLEKKGDSGIEFTISTNDEVNDYGQNVSAYVSQTKEQREAKKPRFYIGNGKVFYTDGKITKAEKKAEPIPAGNSAANDSEPDLPF